MVKRIVMADDTTGELPPVVENRLNDAIVGRVDTAVHQEVTSAITSNSDVVAEAVALAQSDAGLVRSTDPRLPQPAPSDSVIMHAVVDALNRVLIGHRADGSVLVPDLAALWSSLGEAVATSINGVKLDTAPSAVTGYERVWTTQTGQIVLGVRPDGAVHIPALENGESVAALPPTLYRSTYSTLDHKIVSGPDWTLTGHSMLAGATNAITTALSGIVGSVSSLSVGGETSRTIAARQGGQPMTFLPTTGEIPASGPVDVTLRWADGAIAGGWPLLQGPSSYTGALVLADGTRVNGTFGIVRDPASTPYVHHAGDRYTFTRTTPGSVISVTRPTPFYFDVATSKRGNGFLYWIARNNITETDQAIGDLQAMIQRQQGLDKRFLVLSEHNSSTELSGSTNWNAVMAYNQRARALFGRRFIDGRQYLIDYGLADAGITLVPGSQDETDISNGVIPTSLRSDNLHLNAAGSAVIAQLVRRRILELEWTTA